MIGAETNEATPELPLWDRSFNLRTSGGYNDNLLLSPDAREKSAFFSVGLDFTLFRLPLDGKEFTLFLTDEYTRYPDGHELDHELFGLALARFKIDAGAWHPGVDLQYFYQDQVIDASITETNSGPTPVEGHNLNLRPSVRRDLPNGFWLESGAAVSRQFYRKPLDDYWEGGPRLTAGRDYGFKSSIALSYRWMLRGYDSREQVTRTGLGLPGTSLQFQQNEIETTWDHNFDALRRWRSATKLGVLWNNDNGSGYFNFVRYQVSEQLRFVAKTWEAKAQAKFANYDFTRQSARPADPASREKQVFAVTLRAEKKVHSGLKVFTEYTFERATSNRPTDEYLANKVAAGVDWEF